MQAVTGGATCVCCFRWTAGEGRGFLDITLQLNRTVCGYCSRHNIGPFFTIDRSSQYSFLRSLFCSFFNRRVMTDGHMLCSTYGISRFHQNSRIFGSPSLSVRGSKQRPPTQQQKHVVVHNSAAAAPAFYHRVSVYGDDEQDLSRHSSFLARR